MMLGCSPPHRGLPAESTILRRRFFAPRWPNMRAQGIALRHLINVRLRPSEVIDDMPQDSFEARITVANAGPGHESSLSRRGRADFRVPAWPRCRMARPRDYRSFRKLGFRYGSMEFSADSECCVKLPQQPGMDLDLPMSASYQTCHKCGQKFRWVRMPHGQFVPMKPDGSGKHMCNFGIKTSLASQHGANGDADSAGLVPARSWRLESLGRSLTYATRCWWCGQSVFFHTNGNGDCVLLESRGWPWPIHPCWQVHRDESQRRTGMRQLETELELCGYDGTGFSIPEDPVIPDEDDIDWVEYKRRITNLRVKSELRNDSSKRFVWVAGYLSQKEGVSLKLCSDDCCESWCQIEVTSTDSTTDFFVPRQLFDSLSEFSLIRIAGRWCKVEGNYSLIGTRIDWLETVGSESRTLRLAKIGRTARCRYCGRRVRASERWQINNSRVLECGACAAFRGNRDPKEFERFCCRLVRHRGNRRPRSQGVPCRSEAGTGQH
jgi:hypothetical protein